MADAAIQSLNHLRPSSGEAHLALAWHFYLGSQLRSRAEELGLAQQVYLRAGAALLAGYIDRARAGGLNRRKIWSGLPSSTPKILMSPTNRSQL